MPDPAPNIPVGLGTKVGLLAAAVGTLVAAIAAILDGDHSETTITGLLVAAFTVYGVVRSRGDQAAALYRDALSPAQMDDSTGMDDDDLAAVLEEGDDEGEVAVPPQGVLVAQYGEELPPDLVPEGAVGGKPGLDDKSMGA